MTTICNQCRQQLLRQSRRTVLSGGRHRRTFHTTAGQSEDQPSYIQPRALGDFYSDLISTPLPKVARAKTEPDLPEWVASGGRKDIEERAKKLFGTIEGSGYQRQTSDTPDATWQTINGVPIPPRPAEPDNCCMSGCVHCVWDDYRDDVESWAHRLKEAQAKSHGGAVTKTAKVGFPRAEVQAASGSMDDDGGGSEALWTTPSEADPDALFAEIPVGIREFMATEKRIRERKTSKRLAKQI
ncbi:hypothetical protein OHC33_007004 [Knufia fluminis]|uniref:Oxidoreductase-like domain-containing protein n=1 Tax=Knufia fluminis TaxID=191047 RepID=A0AAN8ILD7_9EURO|nr:hypothetical protein OHC33_007004 [Knufia fluminis]